MQSVWIPETLLAEAAAKRKRTLSIKFKQIGSSVRATRTTNKSHGGMSEHQGGF